MLGTPLSGADSLQSASEAATEIESKLSNLTGQLAFVEGIVFMLNPLTWVMDF